jgi:hypothetical protein
MKKILIYLLIATLGLAGCHSKDEAAYYFSDSEQDTLLTNIITYMGEKAVYANDSTKFQPQFRAEYASRLPLYHFVHVTQDAAGTFIYLISRPVAGRKDLRRGVVGRFILKPNSTDILAFEEVVNTPHFDEETLEERGSFLFHALVKEGNLNAYLPMKHYVEWPDSTLKYDKKTHNWVSTISGL